MPKKPKLAEYSSSKKAPSENSSAASIGFMVFGFGLVFYSFFLFHNQKNQASLSSVRPLEITSQIDPETSFERMRKIEGLEVNNQRITAEVNKQQEMLGASKYTLQSVDIQDSLMKGVGLPGEANMQLQLHDRLKDERESYPDVYIHRELAIDHVLYDQALRDEQRDRKIFLEGLKRRAAAQNLDVQYDPKSGEITIDQAPDKGPAAR